MGLLGTFVGFIIFWVCCSNHDLTPDCWRYSFDVAPNMKVERAERVSGDEPFSVMFLFLFRHFRFGWSNTVYLIARVHGQKKRNSKIIKGFSPSSSCKVSPNCFVVACLRYFQQASLCNLSFLNAIAAENTSKTHQMMDYQYNYTPCSGYL